MPSSSGGKLFRALDPSRAESKVQEGELQILDVWLYLLYFSCCWSALQRRVECLLWMNGNNRTLKLIPIDLTGVKLKNGRCCSRGRHFRRHEKTDCSLNGLIQFWVCLVWDVKIVAVMIRENNYLKRILNVRLWINGLGKPYNWSGKAAGIQQDYAEGGGVLFRIEF